MKKYLGIDLGGTNIRVAKITEEGEILQVVKAPSKALESQEIIVENIIQVIRQIDDLSDVESIGLGVPGPVDQKNGWMNMASNMPAMTKYPLVKKLEAEFGIKVRMDNDCNVACLAEAYFGHGKDKEIVVYVTHSTGIGCGVCINKQTISGSHGYAGEIGNIIVKREGPRINHLNIGALENESSGTHLVRKANERLNMNLKHAGQVFELKEQGNQIAIDLVDEMTTDFAIALANVGHVLDPDIFILGGGVTQGAQYYFDDLVKKYKSMVHAGMREVEIKLAQLDEPGLIGAAMLPITKG